MLSHFVGGCLWVKPLVLQPEVVAGLVLQLYVDVEIHIVARVSRIDDILQVCVMECKLVLTAVC